MKEGFQGERVEHPQERADLSNASTQSERSTQATVDLQHTVNITVQYLDLGNKILAEPTPPHGFPEETVFNAVKCFLDLVKSSQFVNPMIQRPPKHPELGRCYLLWSC